jgi:hypothetical protein
MSRKPQCIRSLVFVFAVSSAVLIGPLFSQSINSGTVVGTVLDPQQMIVMDATAELRNPVTGYKQTAT